MNRSPWPSDRPKTGEILVEIAYGRQVTVKYEMNRALSPEDFVDVLERSGLAERRPTGDLTTMRGMVENTNLIVTAWDGDLLVGVARSMTDFHYACYLSDLAVDRAFQKQSIGRVLLRLTTDKLGPQCKLILVSAPAANDYYSALGFEKNERTWVLPRGKQIDS